MCAYTHISVGRAEVTQVAQVGSASKRLTSLPDSERPRQEIWGQSEGALSHRNRTTPYMESLINRVCQSQ